MSSGRAESIIRSSEIRIQDLDAQVRALKLVCIKCGVKISKRKYYFF
jgi:hypothetical protein